MKFSIFTAAVLATAFADSVVGRWCGCWKLPDGHDTTHWYRDYWDKSLSSSCCVSVTGSDLMAGAWLNINGAKGWCDVGDKRDELYQCCQINSGTDYVVECK